MNIAVPTDINNAASVQRSRGVGRLTCKADGSRTAIENLYQQGCCKIRIPAQIGTDALQAVMVNSSGGMTGGDRLDWQFQAGVGTTLTVTTQACERVYKSSGGAAETKVDLKIEQSAKLAWLPQETILFDEGRFSRTINVVIKGDGELLMVEPVIFGRQAMGEAVEQGEFRDCWRIRHNGKLLHAENFALSGEISRHLVLPAVSGGARAMATILLVAPRAEGLLVALREKIAGFGTASFWNGKLLARIVAKDGYELRKGLADAIHLLNQQAPLPKIWSI
ncbi:MAG: urease accessory protein UreD [Pseudomonadota bacterium]